MRQNPSGKVWIKAGDPFRENLKAYYRDSSIVLPEHQQERLSRIKYIIALYLSDNYQDRKELFDKHAAQFNISPPIVLEDWKLAQEVAKLEETEVHLERAYVIERYREAMNMARDQGDTKAFVAAVKAYADAAGVNNHESENFTPDKLEAIPVVIMLDPISQRIMAAFGEQMNLMNEFSSSIDLAPMVQNIDFEEIKQQIDVAETD